MPVDEGDDSQEDDYMSSKFTAFNGQDSIDPVATRKRKHARNVDEKTQRDAGMNKKLDSNNKGYKLFEKMAGKIEIATEPIEIQTKTDRHGLGSSTSISQEEIDSNTQSPNKIAKFRWEMKKRNDLKRIKRQLIEARAVCEQLDREKDSSRHAMWSQDDLSESILSYDEIEENLGKLVSYLRTKHLYCLWCGCSYESDLDLNSECPGLNFEDH